MSSLDFKVFCLFKNYCAFLNSFDNESPFIIKVENISQTNGNGPEIEKLMIFASLDLPKHICE